MRLCALAAMARPSPRRDGVELVVAHDDLRTAGIDRRCAITAKPSLVHSAPKFGYGNLLLARLQERGPSNVVELLGEDPAAPSERGDRRVVHRRSLRNCVGNFGERSARSLIFVPPESEQSRRQSQRQRGCRRCHKTHPPCAPCHRRTVRRRRDRQRGTTRSAGQTWYRRDCRTRRSDGASSVGAWSRFCRIESSASSNRKPPATAPAFSARTGPRSPGSRR